MYSSNGTILVDGNVSGANRHPKDVPFDVSFDGNVWFGHYEPAKIPILAIGAVRYTALAMFAHHVSTSLTRGNTLS